MITVRNKLGGGGGVHTHTQNKTKLNTILRKLNTVRFKIENLCVTFSTKMLKSFRFECTN